MKPYLVITVDHDHGVALVRGPEARRVCRLLTGTTRWSASGRGFVIDETVVADVVAYAQSVHEFVVIGKRKPAVAPTEQVSDSPGGAA